MIDNIYLVAVFLAVISVGVIYHFHTIYQLKEAIKLKESAIKESDKKFHQQEHDFLDAKNQYLISASENMKSANVIAHNEGRLLGKSESKRECENEHLKQLEIFSIRATSEKDKAVKDVYEKLQHEYESQLKSLRETIRKNEISILETDKKFHLRELNFIEEKNKIAITTTEKIKADTAIAHEDGRLLGKAESKRDYANEQANQLEEFSRKIVEEKDKAAQHAREKLRLEYELQSKIFSVKISPYCKIENYEWMVSTKREVSIGYQYQLLVNGIPAFQPHIVIERKESYGAIDQKMKDQLLSLATDMAKAAINTYLGMNPQYAKLSSAIID